MMMGKGKSFEVFLGLRWWCRIEYPGGRMVIRIGYRNWTKGGIIIDGPDVLRIDPSLGRYVRFLELRQDAMRFELRHQETDLSVLMRIFEGSELRQMLEGFVTDYYYLRGTEIQDVPNQVRGALAHAVALAGREAVQ